MARRCTILVDMKLVVDAAREESESNIVSQFIGAGVSNSRPY
jgi:hypothetical protein